MGLPVLLKKIFESDGYGPKLNRSVIPFAASLASESPSDVASAGWVKDLVNVTVYVNASVSSSGDGLTAATAVKTVAEGLDILNALPSTSGIRARLVIAAGTYNENVDITSLHCDISIDGNVVINGYFQLFRSNIAVNKISTGSLTVSNMLAVKNSSYAEFNCSINIVASNSSEAPIVIQKFSCAIFKGSSNIIDITATNINNSVIHVSYSCLALFYQKVNIHGSSVRDAALFMEGNCICYIDNDFITTNITNYGFYITNHSWIYVNNKNVDITLYGGHLLYASVFSRMSFEDFGTISLTRNSYNEAVYAIMQGSILFNASNDANAGKLVVNLGNYNALAFGANMKSFLYIVGYVKISLSGTCSTVMYSRYMSLDIVGTAVTFSGTPTGKRYQTSDMSGIETYGGGANRFPGTTAGTASSSSFYQ